MFFRDGCVIRGFTVASRVPLAEHAIEQPKTPWRVRCDVGRVTAALDRRLARYDVAPCTGARFSHRAVPSAVLTPAPTTYSEYPAVARDL